MAEFTDDEVEQIIESAGPRGNSVRNTIDRILAQPVADDVEGPEATANSSTDTGEPAPADPAPGGSGSDVQPAGPMPLTGFDQPAGPTPLTGFDPAA